MQYSSSSSKPSSPLIRKDGQAILVYLLCEEQRRSDNACREHVMQSFRPLSQCKSATDRTALSMDALLKPGTSV